MPLFHYTNVNAIYSILETKKLWLTDIRFLNDTKELHDGMHQLSMALQSPQPGVISDFDYIDETIELLRGSLADTLNYGIDSEHVYVFSLGRVGDLLSQWRSYGSYALEIDENLLKENFPNLKQCIYLPQDKINAATLAVTNAITDISRDIGKNNGQMGIQSYDLLGDFLGTAATFKDDGFAEEQEVRIVLNVEEGSDSIKYAPRGNKLIPYLEVDIPLDCIKAIHIGPMVEQDLAYISMSAFARKIEKDWQIQTSNIEYWLQVKKSSIPYRAK